MTDEVRLDTRESLGVLAEATKIQVATNYARLVTPTHDEDGNELSEEVFQGLLNEAFYEQLEEFNKTLTIVGQRLLDAKRSALGGQRSSGLHVVKGESGVDPEA